MEQGTYTSSMEKMLQETVDADYWSDSDYRDFMPILNNEDSITFHPFSKRLLDFLNMKLGTDYSLEDNSAALDLLKRLASHGIELKTNTVKNWFKGKSDPKKGDDGRETMFMIAFALDLSLEEAANLLQRVFLDKAFNLRNKEEFIYLYCLNNGRTFKDAQELIRNVVSQSSDDFKETVLLKEKGFSINDDSELLDFINMNSSSFINTSVSANYLMKSILEDLQGSKNREGLAEKELNYFKANYKYHEGNNNDLKSTLGRNVHSVDFVLDMAIKGPQYISKDNETIKPIKEIFQNRDIINNFPNSDSISNPKTSYTMRKNIILLYFYRYWVQKEIGQGLYCNHDEFVEELNVSLEGCGFSPLYAGNPYDWLFLYCSACNGKAEHETPLQVLRCIMFDGSNIIEDEL